MVAIDTSVSIQDPAYRSTRPPPFVMMSA